jgi:predicted ATPase
MTNEAPLKSFRSKNFKAVRDSKTIKFGDLTVLIGNNGSGKSSIIEGLETYRNIIFDGLDEAMSRWKGFEHIQNKAVSHRLINYVEQRSYRTNPICFEIGWNTNKASIEIATDQNGDKIFIRDEEITLGKNKLIGRDGDGYVFLMNVTEFSTPLYKYEDNDSAFAAINFIHPNYYRLPEEEISSFTEMYNSIKRWQFVNLNPAAMGDPRPRRRTDGRIDLANDGSNIAEYLLSIRQKDQAVFDGIVETLQYVLPYGKDLQSAITSELERTVYLQMTEGNFKVPGWLLSTGTLRVVALLALLRHPEPAPLIVIEEIENGLDPRTMNLIVEEIRNAIGLGRTQVILTTHSPYLLDLLDLSHIVLVERDETGQPTFTRPSDVESLQDWAKKYSPGQLYTMGRLQTQPDT